MPKPKNSDSMTAAECARRTGITVKALRVYERHGLIKPARSGKGWRLYGPQELLRLNAIAALKSLGFTLAQIRDVFGTSPPPLERVMRMQRDTWRARRAAADKALDLVDAALARIGNRQSLPVDDLCDLLRNLEMDTVKSITRNLFTEMFAPDEQWQWFRDHSRLSRTEAAASREGFDASRALAMEFRKLLEQDVAPASRKAQALLERANEHWLKHQVRAKLLMQLEKDPAWTRKRFRFSNQLLERSVMPDRTTEGRLSDYISEVRDASGWGRAIDVLIGHARALCARKEKPASAASQKLARNLAGLCQRHSLGDPVVYARWNCEFGKSRYRGQWRPHDAPTRAAWQHLAEAALGVEPATR
jgi:DNA-binding transcriptional MerR regulator